MYVFISTLNYNLNLSKPISKYAQFEFYKLNHHSLKNAFRSSLHFLCKFVHEKYLWIFYNRYLHNDVLTVYVNVCQGARQGGWPYALHI